MTFIKQKYINKNIQLLNKINNKSSHQQLSDYLEFDQKQDLNVLNPYKVESLIESLINKHKLLSIQIRTKSSTSRLKIPKTFL